MKINFKDKISGGSKIKTEEPQQPTKIQSHTKLNLHFVKANYNKETNDFTVTIDDKTYNLLWDTSKVRFVVLYALPNNKYRDMWTGVEYDLSTITEDKLNDILKYWSPIRDQQFVYVALHGDNAILTKVK